ncbi:MAG: alpha-2-macroglobulin family protein, partial [Bacteroidia bacterium]|nr:alpha-2-macroglobulin family protein [Bacteroidia bacterium]MDW8334016.1 alpha-2-macroglobulin family protein [Bacteroidia bacterium]
GPARADGDGVYVCRMRVPAFSGRLRVMAAAWKDDAFAGAETFVQVADPLVVSNGAPRFLAPEDTVLVPVTVANTTSQTMRETVVLTAQGACRIVSTTQATVELGANREQTIYFRVAATGLGEATLKASAGKYADEAVLTVRPAAPLSRIVESGRLAAGTTNVDFSHTFLPQTVRTRLVVSPFPVLEFARDFTDLLEYPHGCTEQTVMTAFPQLYLSDLAKTLTRVKGARLANKGGANPSDNVKAAIAKLQATLNAEGVPTYWPGGVEVNDWAAVCAAHFLIEAQEAGYAVNAGVLSGLKAYLERLAAVPQKQRNFYRRESIYALFVLALAGEKPISALNFYRERWNELTHESRELLRGAYRLAGQSAPERDRTPIEWNYQGEDGESFSSPIRDLALTVYVATQIGEDEEAFRLARRLSELIKQKERLNTQEAGFALLALGKLSQKTDDDATATIVVEGKKYSSAPGKDLVVTENLAGKTVSIETQGTLYFYKEIEGVPTGKAKAQSTNLQVRKSYFSRTGAPLDPTNLKQNDLAIVKLSVSVPSGETIDNVVVTDLLPACFEIENPRLTLSRELDWVSDRSYPDHFDLRDDRIHFYASVSGNEKHFYYAARVTLAGRFEVGPVAAEAMYLTDYRAVSPTRRINVVARTRQDL